MAGDPTNASLWADADVYVGPLTAPNPADASTDFGVEWGFVGLLDGEEGFTETREEEKNDFYAWGGLIVATSRRNFKLTKKFTVLEDNAVTRDVIWPGSSTSSIIVPRPTRIKLGFETRTGGKIKRLITALYAEVDVDGDIKDSETDLTKVPLAATIFPTSGGVLFVRQFVDE